MKPKFTDVDYKVLKMWLAGRSAEQIGAVLNMSRNAAFERIRKMRRHGVNIPKRGGGWRPGKTVSLDDLNRLVEEYQTTQDQDGPSNDK